MNGQGLGYFEGVPVDFLSWFLTKYLSEEDIWNLSETSPAWKDVVQIRAHKQLLEAIERKYVNKNPIILVPQSGVSARIYARLINSRLCFHAERLQSEHPDIMVPGLTTCIVGSKSAHQGLMWSQMCGKCITTRGRYWNHQELTCIYKRINPLTKATLRKR